MDKLKLKTMLFYRVELTFLKLTTIVVIKYIQNILFIYAYLSYSHPYELCYFIFSWNCFYFLKHPVQVEFCIV